MDVYIPVNCDFYNQLEALATLRQESQIVYQNAKGELAKVQGRIVDVYAKHKVEFLKADSGTTIRLDRIISVNDQEVSSWTN
ncbi:hypothetical protein [Gloeocapsopsis dulcis]|uniref:Rho-binding antiterminator n=1 Tax=Gloeocapsopsis dulcis AAB1 = 1H9 TaxID=1433147 RepID=A0A6N8FZL9_9CHRO|nr:hypothetical protein [Gloeocapsopsis dulcis]MUL38578.1 hypothetical protein [Gloeocapsopsis dulcis AAB1 = 1H9]WNN91138.1 hypothetical protein P0S91_08725 [Gloeocapsopsis dulcis]